MDNNKKADLKSKNSWGCGCLLNFLGILAIIFLVGNLIQLITGHFDNSEENISALKGCGVIAVIFILVHIDKFVSFVNGIISAYRKIFPSKPYSAKEIEKMILEENDESCKTFLRGLETLYNKEKADEIICVGDDLTIKQRETFMKLSSAFDELRSCDKIWLILSQTDNSKYRSLVSLYLTRRDVRFTTENFNNVRTMYALYVPTFNAGDYYYFFYPKFIIKAKAKKTADFNLFPISEIILKYESHKFTEDPDSADLPKDSRIISYTYEKSNVDGTPDLRFKNNKKLPIYQYGGINIDAFKLKYMFSNAEKAKAFNDSFAEHKAAILCESKQKESSQITKERPDSVANNLYGINNDGESKKDIFGGVTETYFDKALKVTIPLYNFYKQIFQDTRIMQAMDTALKGSKNSSRETLNFLFLSDILTCYSHLGYDATNLLRMEGLPMALFEGKTLSESAVTYSMIQKDGYKKIVDVIGAMNKTVLDILPKDRPEDFFYMDDVFKSFKTEDLRTQYFSLLYRFFSVIAKADEHISPEEGKWLERLMFFSTTKKDYDLDAFEMKMPINEKLTKEEPVISSNQDKVEVNPLEELQTLIGLKEVKQEVSALSDFVKIQQEREKKGLKTVGLSYHCVFTGNPGTGKTTVARILAAIYKDLGILKKGHLVETDRSGLVAEYVGQTAVKTNKIIDSALDGVLFIDEAYSLVQGSGNDYGQEAISTLLKRMEDERNRLIVVLAGYSDEMKRFIDSNPGLQSRFTRYIHFADYTADELKQIFMLNVKQNQYILEPEGEEKLSDILYYAVEHKDKNFGNGRYVRNLFEKTIQNQAIRLSCKPCVTAEELSELKAEDLSGTVKKEDSSVEENNSSQIKKKPRLDLDLIFKGQVPNEDGDYIVSLTDGSGNEVKDETKYLLSLNT